MVVVAALAVGSLASGVRAAAPADLAGHWTGTWQNLRFGSTGSITADVTVPADGASAVIVYQITGNVFGCSQASGTIALTKGAEFNDKRVKFTTEDAVFGHVHVKSKKQTLSGGGSKTCGGQGPGLWTMKARFDGTTLSGKMTITKIRGTAGSAKTAFSLTRP